jgi:hypothetical protein
LAKDKPPLLFNRGLKRRIREAEKIYLNIKSFQKTKAFGFGDKPS